MLRYYTGTEWTPDSALLLDTYSKNLNSNTVSYLGYPSAPNLTAVGQSGNAGQLDVYWTAPGSSGMPDGSGSGAMNYLVRNDSTGGQYGAAGSPWSQGGLANSTAYYYRVAAANTYRPIWGPWSNQGGQYTRTVAVGHQQDFSMQSSQNYKQSGAQRTDAPAYLYHGYYSSTYGDQRSLAWFGDIRGTLGGSDSGMNGFSVTAHSAHWYYNNGGTCRVYYYHLNAAGGVGGVSFPGTWGAGSEGYADVAAFSFGAKTGWGAVGIAAGWAAYWATRNDASLCFIGGGTSLTGYGYFSGPGTGANPYITINWTDYV